MLVGKFDNRNFSTSITYFHGLRTPKWWEIINPITKLTDPLSIQLAFYSYLYSTFVWEAIIWLLIKQNPHKIFNHFTLFFARKRYTLYIFFFIAIRDFSRIPFARRFFLFSIFYLIKFSHFSRIANFLHFYSFVFLRKEQQPKSDNRIKFFFLSLLAISENKYVFFFFSFSLLLDQRKNRLIFSNTTAELNRKSPNKDFLAATMKKRLLSPTFTLRQRC
jgi:hypothetical protein